MCTFILKYGFLSKFFDFLKDIKSKTNPSTNYFRLMKKTSSIIIDSNYHNCLPSMSIKKCRNEYIRSDI